MNLIVLMVKSIKAFFLLISLNSSTFVMQFKNRYALFFEQTFNESTMCQEEWEREKKEEEEEKGKAIEIKKLINHTTKKWEAVNSIMSAQFCDL